MAKRAKYAPSVINLFMNQWEKEATYDKNIPELKFYKRYIYDILIEWAGSQESFCNFLKEMEDNFYGVSFL